MQRSVSIKRLLVPAYGSFYSAFGQGDSAEHVEGGSAVQPRLLGAIGDV